MSAPEADIVFLSLGGMPGSRLVTVKGSGHFPHVERAGEFNTVLSEFLGSHSGGAAEGLA
jgi:pimeloyl-ACP methyl ester carboxylesterase